MTKEIKKNNSGIVKKAMPEEPLPEKPKDTEEKTYQLEVKIPDGKGGYTTQLVKLDYETNVANKPIIFDSYAKFPSIGKVKTLYIATDLQRIYRFDEKEMIYKIIGSDWNEITLIDCGGATSGNIKD